MKFFVLFMMLSLGLLADIRKITNQLFFTKAGDLYYVAEKIASSSQFVTWQLMVDFNQGEWASQFKDRFPGRNALASGTIDASGSLLGPLCDWSDMEAWVIYVMTKEPNMNGFEVFGAERARNGLLNGDISSGFQTTNDYETFMKKFRKKSFAN